MKIQRIMAGLLAATLSATSVTIPIYAEKSIAPLVTEAAKADNPKADPMVLVGEAVPEYEYKVLDDGTLMLTAYNGSESDLVIPSEIDGKTVTAVDKDLPGRAKSVFIPDTVNFIGDLENGACGFYSCWDITNVYVDENNPYFQSIDGVLFDKSGETLVYYPSGRGGEYTVPDGVVTIGNYAFNYGLIGSVILPDSVKYLNEGAFFVAFNLYSINLGDNIEYIGKKAFCDCWSLQSIDLPNTITVINEMAFAGSYITSINIPESVKVIDVNAFELCKKLIYVDLPEGLESINEGAFSGCPELKSITIPKSVNSIGDYAIGYDVDSKHNYADLVPDFKIYCYKDTAGEQYAKDNEIEYELLDDDKEAETENYEYKVLDDGTLMLTAYNGSEENLVIPSEIDGKTVTALSRNLPGLAKSVFIPDTVSFIGDLENGASGFYCCWDITDVYVDENNPYFQSIDGVLFDKSGETLVYYPSGKGGEYTVPDGVVTIGNYAFNYGMIGSVILPDSVKYLNEGAFLASFNLYSINLGDNIEYIGKGAFCDCWNLQSIDLPNTITVINEDTFAGSDIISINIPESVKVIDVNAFELCEKLIYVDLPEGLESINEGAFLGCSELKSITIPKSVNSIGEYAIGYDVDYEKNISKVPNFIICCYKDTAGEQYAKDNEIEYELLNMCEDGHSFSEWVVVKEATCTEDGERQRECVNCGAIESEVIPATGHTFVDKVVNPTYTSKGYTLHTCSVCGYSYKDKYTDKLVLSSVSGFKASAKTDKDITLKWSKNSAATGYIIEVYKDNKWVRVAKITDNATTSYKVTKRSASTRYAFRIQAYKEIGSGAVKSAYTNKLVVYTNPTAVSGFKASAKTDKDITLNWSKNSSATGYIIEVYKDNKWVRVAKITDNATTSYKVTKRSASTRYAFRIQAYKEIGSGAVKSAYTNKLVVYTNPTAVSGFKASAKTKNTVTLSWNKNTSATGYIIQQYKDGKWVRIAKIDKNATVSYKVTGLNANTRYAFRIQAYKEIGSGAVKSTYTDKLVVYTTK